MNNVRLTKSIRTAILQKLLDNAFSERETELAKDKEALGKEIYDDLYPKDLRKKMAALPEGFMVTSAYAIVAFGGQVTQVMWGQHRRIKYEASTYHAQKDYEAKRPVVALKDLCYLRP